MADYRRDRGAKDGAGGNAFGSVVSDLVRSMPTRTGEGIWFSFRSVRNVEGAPHLPDGFAMVGAFGWLSCEPSVSSRVTKLAVLDTEHSAVSGRAVLDPHHLELRHGGQHGAAVGRVSELVDIEAVPPLQR